MKYMAIIDADEKPVSCEFFGRNGNFRPCSLGTTTDIKALDQEPCEDAISRQAVLKYFDTYDFYKKGCMKNYVKSLPSVQPIRPKGEWMNVLPDYYHCSLCKKEHCFKTNFCSNCGADMRKVEE